MSWEEAIAKDMKDNPEKYRWLDKKHTGRFTGREGNAGMAVYNPKTGNYERYSAEEWHKKSLDHRRATGENSAMFYTNRFGEDVYGYRPTESYSSMKNGESWTIAGKDPYANKYLKTDNGTPVPSTGMLNPDFVEPESRFATRENPAVIGYHGRRKTPAQLAKDRRDAVARAIEEDPSRAESPEFLEALINIPGFADVVASSGLMAPDANVATSNGLMAPDADVATSNGLMAPNADVATSDGLMAPNADAGAEYYNSPEFADALVKNPEFQALFKPKYSAAGNSALYDHPDYVGANGEVLYTQEDLAGMTPEQAFNLMNEHGTFFHANKNNPDIHSTVTKQQGRAMANPAFAQKITDYAVSSKGGVQQFLNAIRGLQYHNPAAFEEWELANPEMAIRYHARAKAPNGQVGGIEGYDHGTRAQQLAFWHSKEHLGYGDDGKKDGRAIAFDFDQFNDVNSENGDGDFWKLGTAQTFTNDFSDFVEDNPWQVVGTVAAIVAAPYLAELAAPLFLPAGTTMATAAPAVSAAALSTAGTVTNVAMASINTAIAGGDAKDVMSSAFVAGIPLFQIPGFDLDNFVGSLVRSGTTDVLSQLVSTGQLDLGQTLKSMGTRLAMDTVTDIFMDAGQTRSAEDMVNSGMSLNGTPITMEQALVLENTTDVLGLFGPEGALAQIGIDVPFLPTGFIGDAADFVSGYNARTVINTPEGDTYTVLHPNNAPDAQIFDSNGVLVTDPDLLPMAVAGQDGYELVQYSRNTLMPDVDMSRYDERFFDVSTDRDPSSPLEGVWTENPVASSSTGSTSVGGSSNSGSGTPSADTGKPPVSPIDTNSTPIADSLFEDTDLTGTSGQGTNPLDSDFDLVDAGGSDTPYLPSAGGDVSTFPSAGGDVSTLPSAGGDVSTLPSADYTTLPPSGDYSNLPDVGGLYQDQLPSTSGPGGGGKPPPITPEAREFLLEETDRDLFRLARIQRVRTLSQREQMEFQDLLSTRDALLGDLVAAVDKQSTERVQHETIDPSNSRDIELFDPLEKALKEVRKV